MTVWKHEHVHLGVAVSVPAGLLVPVVRDADMLSVRALHDRTAEVVGAARTGQAQPGCALRLHVQRLQHGHVRGGAVHGHHQPR